MNGRKITNENISISTSLRFSDDIPLIVYDIDLKYSKPVRLNIVHPLPKRLSPEQVVPHPKHEEWEVRSANKLPPSVKYHSNRPTAVHYAADIPSNTSHRTYYAVDSNKKSDIQALLELSPEATIIPKSQQDNQKRSEESRQSQRKSAKNRKIADPISQLVTHVDGYTFEHFIADLWERQGWETHVTDGSGDEGVDVVAIRHEPYRLVSNIQVKHYTDSVISRPDVQQYSGLHQLMDVDTVAIVASSSFSGPAQDWAEKTNVKLVDGDGVARLIDELEAYDLVREYIS